MSNQIIAQRDRANSGLTGYVDGLGTLTVLMPAYNERAFVKAAVDAARVSAQKAEWSTRFVIVDDGSTDADSQRVLDILRRDDDVEVVHLPENRGRFAARATGLATVSTPYVLLLDARVEVEPEALSNLRRQVSAGHRVWNFDVEPAERTVFALFWTGITKLWWRSYFRNRVHVAFTEADFDRFPKGTGAFFAPTSLLTEAAGAFDSLFADRAMASDDTRLLRDVASRMPINIAPEITCRHHVKAGGGAWVRQCRYRGTTFVDGYLGDARRAGPVLLLMTVLGLGWSFWALRRPRRLVGSAFSVSTLAAGLTKWSGGSSKEAASVGLLTIPFGVLFGSGVVRGLLMAVRRR